MSRSEKAPRLRSPAALRAALDGRWTEVDLEASGLSSKRKLYEEGVAAFDALERALERGYVEITD